MGAPEQRWTVTVLGASPAPPDHLVSAVFLLAMNDDLILAVRNERGWDIPGGHVAPDETPTQALARETLEEAGATFSWAEPFATVSVPEHLQVMLFYATSAFALSIFTPAEDALERTLLSSDDLMKRYCGPVEVLRTLVEGARARLSRIRPGSAIGVQPFPRS
jgi:ADP-ribose pyrophosphatase YjhB (NUDIX family)